MRLFLVRHGESTLNNSGITQGQSNSVLTGRGISQAESVAVRLKQESFDIAFVSDLIRTKQTAQEILKYHPDLPVVYTRKIRERSAGIYEGLPKHHIMEQYEKTKSSFANFKPEKGESFTELQQRAKDFYEYLLDTQLGKTVLLVSHGGFIGSLLLYLTKKPLDVPSFQGVKSPNCALTVLEIDDNKNHQVRLLNCVRHL